MADRPLRPATRQSLGEPLPHQLADRPRAHPEAQKHFLNRSCDQKRISGINPSFPGLSRSSGQVAHVLLTRSPLRHGLGYPYPCVARLACIRHAASVRPEPGSNSPTYIHSVLRRQSCRSLSHGSHFGSRTLRSELLIAIRFPLGMGGAQLLTFGTLFSCQGAPATETACERHPTRQIVCRVTVPISERFGGSQPPGTAAGGKL